MRVAVHGGWRELTVFLSVAVLLLAQMPGSVSAQDPSTPVITSVSAPLAGSDGTIALKGEAFGALPTTYTLPYAQSTEYLQVADTTQHATVGLRISSWSDTTILTTGTLAGFSLKAGDQVTVKVCNPESNICSSPYAVTVVPAAVLTIAPAGNSFIALTPQQMTALLGDLAATLGGVATQVRPIPEATISAGDVAAADFILAVAAELPDAISNLYELAGSALTAVVAGSAFFASGQVGGEETQISGLDPPETVAVVINNEITSVSNTWESSVLSSSAFAPPGCGAGCVYAGPGQAIEIFVSGVNVRAGAASVTAALNGQYEETPNSFPTAPTWGCDGFGGATVTFSGTGSGRYTASWTPPSNPPGCQPPSVSAVTPNEAYAGETVTVTGSGLTGATAVAFGPYSSPRPPVEVSATELQATAPNGCGTQPVTVRTPIGTSTQAVPFTFLLNPLQTAPSAPPPGIVGQAYSYTLPESGGCPPYRWSVVSGQLAQDGLSLSSAGSVAGVPVAPGTISDLVFQVRDGLGQTAQTPPLSITVTALPLEVDTTSLPPAQLGVPYRVQLQASGGYPAYRWRQAGATPLPAGLTLSPAGVISGTPAAQGTSTGLRFAVTDSRGSTASTASLSLTVTVPHLVCGAGSLPAATVGVPYTAELSATLAAPPYQWALISGTLPAGLELVALGSEGTMGVITGTPRAPGSSGPLVVRVTDRVDESVDCHLSLTVQGLSLSFLPTPIAATGSLGPNQSVPFALHVSTSGGQPAGGATVYISFQRGPSGGTVTVDRTGQVLSDIAVPYTADTAGVLSLTYSAGALLDHGVDTVTAQDNPEAPTVTATDSYVYPPVTPTAFAMSPAPLAAPGSLSPGQTVSVVVTALGPGQSPLPGATVYLVFDRASGGGSAAVDGVPLTTVAAPFSADNHGNLDVNYTTPALPPESGTDVLVAENAASAPSASVNDAYDFALAPPSAVKEFAVPTPQSQPTGLALAPDGTVWFAEAAAHKIGRLSPQGTIQEFPVPEGSPQDVVVAPDGDIWFTDWGGCKAWIGRMTTDGTATLFALQSAEFPFGLTEGPNGAIWFTAGPMPGCGGIGAEVGEMTTSGATSLFPVGGPNAGITLRGIAAGPDGNLWIAASNGAISTANGGGAIARMTPSGALTWFPLPFGSTCLAPDALTPSASGALWFAAGPHCVGQISTAGAVEYISLPAVTPTSSFFSTQQSVAVDAAGNLWVAGGPGDTDLFRVAGDGQATAYPMAGSDAGIDAVAIGPAGDVWFAQPFANTIGRLAVAPVLASVAPAQAPAGSPVTLTGEQFGTVAGSVYWQSTGGAPGVDQSVGQADWTATSVSSSVPADLQPGPAWVTLYNAAGRASNRIPFMVLPAPPPAGVGETPALLGVEPAAGPDGTQVTLLGSGFGTVAGSVYWQPPGGGTPVVEPVAQADWADGLITTTVPGSLSPGAVFVAVYSGVAGQLTNADPFRVAAGSASGAPLGELTPLSLTPTSVPVNGHVVIGGTLTGPTGAPISGAVITLLTSGGTLSTPDPRTAADGSFADQLTAPGQPGPVDLLARAQDQILPQSLVPFGDVAQGDWFYIPAEELASQGIVAPDAGGNFDPNGPMALGEFEQWLDAMVGVLRGVTPPSCNAEFGDLPPGNWCTGSSQSLTRQEMAVLLSRALDLSASPAPSFTDANLIAPWALAGVQAAVGSGYMSAFPDGTFQPLASVTRAQAAASLAIALAPVATAVLSVTAGSPGGPPAMPPVIVPPPRGTLPAARVGVAYRYRLRGFGGVGPYTWSLLGGALPPGLSLDAASGAIFGAATKAGSSVLTVRLADAETPPATATATMVLRVGAGAPLPLTLCTPALPTAVAGLPYAASLCASGGSPAYTWSVSGGELPAGLSLDTVAGVVYGTPSAKGTDTFEITVADQSSPPVMATGKLALIVLPEAAPPPVAVPPLAESGLTLQPGLTLVSPTVQPANATTDEAVPIVVGLADAEGVPALGQTVDFATSHGSLSAQSAVTDASGLASVVLEDATAGTDTVTISANGRSSTVAVRFRTPAPMPPPVTGSLALPQLTTGVDLNADLVGSYVEVAPLGDVGGVLGDLRLVLSGLTDGPTVADSVYGAVYTSDQAAQLIATHADIALLGFGPLVAPTFVGNVVAISNPAGNLGGTLFDDAQSVSQPGIQATFSFDPALVPAGVVPEVVWLDTATSPPLWTNAGVTILSEDPAAGTITALLPHLSTYTVVAVSSALVSGDVLAFTPSPIAPAGDLSGGQMTTVTLAATNASGDALVGATVFLAFRGRGTATVNGTALSGTSQRFATGNAGTLSIRYAPASAGGGTDVITAASDASAAPAVSAMATYTYGARQRGGTGGAGASARTATTVSTTEQTAETVGSAGGILASGDGSFTMTVPAGYVGADQTLAVSTSGAVPGGAPNLPDGFTAASEYITLTGSPLSQPVPATIQFTGAEGQAASVFADGAWHYVPTAFGQGTATVYVDGPGTFVVLTTHAGFPDVPSGFWAASAIQTLAGAGIVDGLPDGTFQPQAALTRAEFVKMLDLTLNLRPVGPAANFHDVGANDWFAPYVAAAVQAGLVRGLTPTSFAPDQSVTREQAAVILARALKLTGSAKLTFRDAGQIDGYAVPAVEAALAAGYLNGFPDGSFRPLAAMTRAEAAKVLAMALKAMAP